MTTNKIILFEYDKPILQNVFLNYAAGIWKWCISPGTVIVADDNSNTGYYSYTNSIIYNIKSLTVDANLYLQVDNLIDLETQDEAFYYDISTATLYITFTNYEPYLNQDIFLGATLGFTMQNNSAGNYYFDNYYEPLLTSITGIKKSKDPLFYGLLKYNAGTVKFINTSGIFDDWRDRNLYRQPARIMLGNDGDSYSSFIQIASGVIGEHSRSWTDFSIKYEDPRNVLSIKLPKNKLTQSTPHIVTGKQIGRAHV